jgi:hypothetical protein
MTKDNINSITIRYNILDLQQIAENNNKVLDSNQAIEIIKRLSNDKELLSSVEDYVSSIVLDESY